MIDDDKQFKDGPLRIKEMMESVFGDDFKMYSLGEPEEITVDQLPCVMISEKQGSIVAGPSGMDRVTETVQIIIAMNKLDDVNAPSDDNLTERKLQQLIKGQDPATGNYKERTIAYALRKHFTLNGGTVSSRLETNFDINIRGEDTFTQEATVTVYIERLVPIASRD